MTVETGILGDAGLKFFGLMTASISHELKNVLAIMNENAGLMQDLTLMAQKGGSLNTERISTLAGRFAGQIARADGIINNLNRFAHTVDNGMNETDICDTLRLCVALSERFSSMRGVSIDIEALPSSIAVKTNPFFFSQLVWLCLDVAMDAAGESRRISIGCRQAGSQIIVEFNGLHGNMDAPEKPLFSATGNRLRETLNAEIRPQPDTGSLAIVL